MTGTAETEAEEFAKIYKLDVIVIPTNRPLQPRRGAGRRLPDRAREVGRDRQRDHREAGDGPAGAGRHGLDREVRAARRRMLKQRGIKHVVLNAKYHAQEAEIVAQAGRKGAVTIATNMAGRGTDILLGGNAEFMARQQCARRGDRRAAAEGRGDASSTTTSSSTSSTSTRSIACRRADWERIFDALQGSSATPSTTRSSASAACTSSAPSATRRGASTTSCAAAPAARATRARRASTCRSKTT